MRTLLLILLLPTLARAQDPAAEAFEAKVRPVLAETCYKCHGPAKQMAGLRLDSREAILKGGDGGPAIVVGEPDKSPMVLAVRHQGDLAAMPPKGRLEASATDAIADWVRHGAPWPASAKAADTAKPHWAFQPVRRSPMPPVKDSTWAASPVDAFVLAALEAKGLTPSPAADRRTLIRRATFDLTGLPPTTAEADAFDADKSHDAEAFAKVVDRLLASTRYGERWGRHWLDVARYADTKGYVFQEERKYPFAYTYRDYVVRAFNEDLPFDQFVTQQIAADRLPAGPDNRHLAALGFLTVGRRFLNVQEDIVDDRIDVVSRGFLGLTVSCARCHDHKFDPIPTEDYYSLFGVFNSSVEPKDLPELTASGPNPAAEDYRSQRAARLKAVEDYVALQNAEARDEVLKRLPEYLSAAAGLGFDPKGPRLDEVAKAANLRPGAIRRVANRVKARLDAAAKQPDPLWAPWLALKDTPPAEFAAKAAEYARKVRDAGPPSEPDADVLRCLDGAADLKTLASRFAASAPIRALLEAPGGPFEPTPAERRGLDKEARNKLADLEKAVAQLDLTHPGVPMRAMVMVDKPKADNVNIFIRGNPGRPGKEAPRRFLKVLEGPDRQNFKDGSGRLELARAVARADNPLTPRVFANRVWMHHFGRGLVATPSDFGTRSDPPSHPELLDELAARFVGSGWSVKALHRLIMVSNTYMQRSDERDECKNVDPQNLLIHRQNRKRLDFESLRDTLIWSAGHLDGRVGGPASPLFTAPFSERRTLYGFVDRQNLDPTYRAFDFAGPDASSPRRFVTTVPQQALFLMNSPFLADQARRLAALPDLAGKAEDVQVELLHRRLYNRPPTGREVDLARHFLAARAAEPTPPGGLAPREAYAQVLLLTNEFAFVD